MDPLKNISLLKENVMKPGSTFQQDLSNRMTMTEFKNFHESVMFVEEEDVKVFGELRKVRRLYIRPPNSDFVGVGWIINEDITSCMVCGESFGLFRWPHHCRSCGNLVCHPCSPESVVIVELQELGEVRVCVQCYWGQYPVHAAHVRKPSFAEVEEEDLSSKTPEKEMKPTPVKETQPPGSQRSGSCRVCPHPIFALFTTRKLSVKDAGPATMHSRTSSRVLFVNICVHAALEEYPVETEFVISEDIYTYKPADSSDASSSSTNVDNTQQEEHVYEVYHVILRPELLSEDALSEDEEQCNQAAEAILIALSEKFGYRLSKKFTLLHEQKYIGDKIQEISLPSITEISSASMSSPSHFIIYAEQDSARKALNSINPMDERAKEIERSKRKDDGKKEPERSPIQYEVNPLNEEITETKINLNAEIEDEHKRWTTEEEEAKRIAAEKAAAEEKERQRKAAEEEAKRKAAEEEAKRIAAEKAAAEEKERQRKAAEEEAKRKAAEEEAKRIAAEKAAAEEKEVSVFSDSSELTSPVNVISPAPIEDALKSSLQSQNDLSVLHNDDHPSNSVPPTSSARPSSMDEGSPSLETLFIPAILVEPTPGVVIKTKREDSTKIFVNVCHHVLIPLLNADNIYVTHPYYPDYLQLYFTQFTLNKSRYVMYVGLLRETADKEGGTCFVSDVVVHTSVFQDCMKDAELCDKFYLKVLKALARHNNTDFDADYKLPKILRNYKGNEVDKLNVPVYTSVGRPVPQTESSRNSFRYGAIDTSYSVSSKIEPTKSEGGVSTAISEKAPVVPSAITGSEPKPVVPTPSPSYFTVDPELNRKWKAFLSPNTNVVHTSLTSKKNMVGMKIVRQLILTDEPGMLYVDTSNMTLKGNIAWDRSNPPKAAVIDKQTFTVEVPGRVYKFTDLSQGANTWVQKINAVVEHNKSARK